MGEGLDIEIEGRGLRGLQRPSGLLDAGNSGSTIRMLSGILAAQPFATSITGDDSCAGGRCAGSSCRWSEWARASGRRTGVHR